MLFYNLYMITINKILIKTKRVLIRPLNSDDFSTFKNYVSKKQEKQLKRMFDKTLKDNNTLGIFIDDILVGAFLFYEKYHKTYIGASTRKDYRNQGIMKEALSNLIDYLFSNNLLENIYAEIDKENYPSINVVTSCGFKPYRIKEKTIIYKK